MTPNIEVFTVQTQVVSSTINFIYINYFQKCENLEPGSLILKPLSPTISTLNRCQMKRVLL